MANYYYDVLGSVVAISNYAGTISEKYTYDVYGNPTTRNAQGVILPTSDVNNRYMFTGREYDSVSGLYYYRARYYSPNIGRFLQTDPVGYYDSMNLYQYCLNNPVNWIDPYGLYTWSEWGRATAHPFEESKVRTARNNANSATQNKYGHNGGNDESDAYRHAYWNIEMTRSMNKKSAEAWANAHENFEGNPQDEKDMDCKNNKAGRDAAADPANAKKSTDEIVNQLIKDGKLQTSLPKDSIGLPAQYD